MIVLVPFFRNLGGKKGNYEVWEITCEVDVKCRSSHQDGEPGGMVNQAQVNSSKL